LIVDKALESFAQSMELIDARILLFQDISRSHDGAEIFDLEEIAEDQREQEREHAAFNLHTSGSTDHPKLIPLVRPSKPTYSFR
jgi:acyl-coenzyme A synthetase/AMP-(fatty) acid ligase